MKKGNLLKLSVEWEAPMISMIVANVFVQSLNIKADRDKKNQVYHTQIL